MWSVRRTRRGWNYKMLLNQLLFFTSDKKIFLWFIHIGINFLAPCTSKLENPCDGLKISQDQLFHVLTNKWELEFQKTLQSMTGSLINQEVELHFSTWKIIIMIQDSNEFCFPFRRPCHEKQKWPLCTVTKKWPIFWNFSRCSFSIIFSFLSV